MQRRDHVSGANDLPFAVCFPSAEIVSLDAGLLGESYSNQVLTFFCAKLRQFVSLDATVLF
jgi:hypothetical protein